MIFKIQKGVFMQCDKTQDYFTNNLAGCFYQNFLILSAKTINYNFMLEVIDLNLDPKNVLKGPRRTKLKVNVHNLALSFTDSSRLKDILHDLQILYFNFGMQHGFLKNFKLIESYESKDFLSLNCIESQGLSHLEVYVFFIKLLSTLKELGIGYADQNCSTQITPFKYALNLDALICEFPENLKNKSTHSVAEFIENNWINWVSQIGLTEKSIYDAVLINSDYLVVVRVNKGQVSVQLVELNNLEGLISSLVCDLDVLKTLLAHRFKELNCYVGSYSDLQFEFQRCIQTTFLPPNYLKLIPYIPNATLHKFLRKELQFYSADPIIKLNNMTLRASDKPKAYVFSANIGLPYVHLFETNIRKTFQKILGILNKKNISEDKLKIINILSKNNLEHELSGLILNNPNDLLLNQAIEKLILKFSNEINWSGMSIDQKILIDIDHFERKYSVKAKLLAKRDNTYILFYEPNVPDNRITQYEWFSEASYSICSQFESTLEDIHKTDITTRIKNVEILHIYQSEFLIWNGSKTFKTPLEKTNALAICMSKEQISTELTNLGELSHTPEYLQNLISSLKHSSMTSSDQEIFGFFFVKNIVMCSTSYAYEGVFLKVETSKPLDLSNTSIKTIMSSDFPKSYKTFKRLIGLQEGLIHSH